MDVTQYSTEGAVIYGWSARGPKEPLPSEPPGTLTCDLSRLPPVFIGSRLFMFGKICVGLQIRGTRELDFFFRGGEVGVCALACADPGTSLYGGTLLSPRSFGPEEGSGGRREQRGGERSGTPTQRV